MRQVILKSCASCHGIDDFAYYAFDRAGWNALIEAKHKGLTVPISDADRGVVLDWVVAKFGPDSTNIPASVRPPGDHDVLHRRRSPGPSHEGVHVCHGIDRVNEARFSADRWRVVTVDMRERGLS